jgi:hypothetical protein
MNAPLALSVTAHGPYPRRTQWPIQAATARQQSSALGVIPSPMKRMTSGSCMSSQKTAASASRNGRRMRRSVWRVGMSSSGTCRGPITMSDR